MTHVTPESPRRSCGIDHCLAVSARTVLGPLLLLVCLAVLTPGCYEADLAGDETTDFERLQAQVTDLEARLDEAEQASAVQGKVLGLAIREIYELSYTTELLADELGLLSGPSVVADELWPGLDVAELGKHVEYDPLTGNYCPVWTDPLGD